MSVFDTIKKLVAGDVAHDATDSGNPVKIGGRAHTSAPTAVANNDRVNAYWDANGRLAVHDGGVSLTVDGSVTAAISSLGLLGLHINGATLAASPVTNYAVGDSVGNKMTLSSAAVTKAALLESVTLQAAGAGTGNWDMAILIFNADPSATTITDDAALSIAAADYPKVDAVIEIANADWVSVGGRKFCTKSGINAVIKTDGNAYAVIVAQDIFSGPANDLEITFGFSQG